MFCQVHCWMNNEDKLNPIEWAKEKQIIHLCFNEGINELNIPSSQSDLFQKGPWNPIPQSNVASHF